MIKIAILVSGNGTNAENIIKYFANNKNIEVSIVMSNKKDAYGLTRARNLNIATGYFNREEFTNGTTLRQFEQLGINWIILAGFLWLVPDIILYQYDGRIVNIHPSLLPKYGGKGMYGDKVHEAVVANHDKESGITIHTIDQHYDEGKTVFQATCQVLPTDNAHDVATKVHALEYEWFPRVIEKLVMNEKIEF